MVWNRAAGAFRQDRQNSGAEDSGVTGDPRMPLSQQVNAYQHRDKWVNRLILGDSLVVMNSLLEYEGWAARCR